MWLCPSNRPTAVLHHACCTHILHRTAGRGLHACTNTAFQGPAWQRPLHSRLEVLGVEHALHLCKLAGLLGFPHPALLLLPWCGAVTAAAAAPKSSGAGWLSGRRCDTCGLGHHCFQHRRPAPLPPPPPHPLPPCRHCPPTSRLVGEKFLSVSLCLQDTLLAQEATTSSDGAGE